MKKYTIVRVDNRCPVEEEEDICLVDRIKMFPCFNDKRLSCKKCNYGDTKEQLIKKVAQIRFKQATQYGSKDMLKAIYNMCYRQAKEIVEFMGVK